MFHLPYSSLTASSSHKTAILLPYLYSLGSTLVGLFTTFMHKLLAIFEVKNLAPETLHLHSQGATDTKRPGFHPASILELT
jgi:hypothetical protein